jgi:4-alpha-glucanotransferase
VIEDGRLLVSWPSLPALVVCAAGGTLALDPAWIEAFDLPLERERGLMDRDRHWRAGHAELTLEPDGAWCGIAAGVGALADDDAAAAGLATASSTPRQRDAGLLARACAPGAPLAGAPRWIARLVLAADSFLFQRPLPDAGDGLSVIAGYPWFGDWGRDTMIALPGLCLATGRSDAARHILRTFARFVRDGLLPNLFPGHGETAAYHSVDAPLWYIEAWRAWLAAGGDDETLAEALPVLRQIIAAYRDGTRFGIGMDPADGLIAAASPGLQLTWMDAKAGDWVVTPRAGKPVEINALWYNALAAMQQFCTRLDADPAPYAGLAERARTGFQRYRRGDGAGLLDVLDGPGGDDASIRPNQVFAVSLPASPLEAPAQTGVVAEIAEHLLTSHGLRSLSPDDPAYHGRYRGDVVTRDGAYHQGTVWAWLLGHYALAEHRVTGDAALALSRLEPLADHLGDAGLGTISEIFDGDPPHRPRGAPVQAWSVACTLEAWWRLTAATGP